jgi:hypothetical protein
MVRQNAASAMRAGSSLRFNHSQAAVMVADNMVIHRLAEKKEMSITVNSLYGNGSNCQDSLHLSRWTLLFLVAVWSLILLNTVLLVVYLVSNKLA